MTGIIRLICLLGIVLAVMPLVSCQRRGTPDPLPAISGFTGESQSLIDAYLERFESARKNPDSIARVGRLAMFYHANGYYDQALEAYEILRKLDPQSGKWPYLQHRVTQDIGDLDGALALLEESIRKAPGYANAYLRKGDILLKTGEAGKAEDAYRGCLAVDPGNGYAYLGLGRIAFEAGDLLEAKDLFKESVTYEPSLASSYNLLASVFMELGDEDNAAKAAKFGRHYSRYREPVDEWLDALNEHCYDSYRLRVAASVYTGTQEVGKALPLLERALRIDPQDPENHLALGQWHLRNGEKSTGMQLVEEARTINPNLSDAHFVLVSEFEMSKEFDKALAAVEIAIRQFPTEPKFFMQKGFILEKLGQAEQAEVAYLKAVELDSGNARYLDAIASFYWTSGRKDEAVTYFERVRENSKVELDARVLLATHYIESGKLEAAKSCLDEAKLIAPEAEEIDEVFSLYFLRKGNELFRAGDTNEAEQSYLRALEIRPVFQEATNNLVALYLRTNRVTKAETNLETLILDYPKASFAYPLIAAIYIKTDRVALARPHLEAGLKCAQSEGDGAALASIKQLMSMIGMKE